MKTFLTTILNVFTLACLGQNIVSLTPNSANSGQTLDVTITGSNTQFTQSSTTAFAYFSQSSSTVTYANFITWISNSQIIANFSIPLTTNPGYYSIGVTDPFETVFAANAFNVVNSSPVISTINPNQGSPGQTLDVTITGSNTHFSQGSNNATLSFNQGSGTVYSIPANSAIPLTDNSVVANFSIPGNCPLGSYNLNVSNSLDGNLSAANVFSMVALTPVIYGVNPNQGSPGQTLDVTISGGNTHFMQGQINAVSFGFLQGSGTTVNSYYPINDSLLAANVTIPSNTAAGYYSVLVDNSIDGILYSNSSFYVNGSSPVVTSISPNSGSPGQTLDLIITGINTHFLQSSSTVVSMSFSPGGGSAVNSYNVLNNETIFANITIPPNTLTNYYTLMVSNSIDGALYLTNFYVNGAPSSGFTVTASPVDASGNNTCDGSVALSSYNDGGNATFLLFDYFGNSIPLTGNLGSNLCPGLYSVNAQDANGNSTSLTFLIGYPDIIFYSSLDSINGFPIISNGVDTSCSFPYASVDSVSILSYSILDNNPSSTYSVELVWNIYTGGVPVPYSNVYFISQSGYYTFELQLFCDSTRALEFFKAFDYSYIDIFSVGTGNNLSGIAYKIFPNPFNESITISVLDSDAHFLITNELGQTVKDGSLIKGNSPIDLRKLDVGLYFLNIQTPSGSSKVKLIKQ